MPRKKRTAQPKKTTERKRRRQHDVIGFKVRMAFPFNIRKHPDFNFRWFNDEGTRLSKAIAADYDFANEDGDEIDRNSSSRYSVHVGTNRDGSPMMAYLMRIRKDWHNEYKEKSQTDINEYMKQIKLEAEHPSDPMRYKSKAVADIRLE